MGGKPGGACVLGERMILPPLLLLWTSSPPFVIEVGQSDF